MQKGFERGLPMLFWVPEVKLPIALKNRCVQGSAAEEFCSAVKKDLILGRSGSGSCTNFTSMPTNGSRRVGHPEQIPFNISG